MKFHKQLVIWIGYDLHGIHYIYSFVITENKFILRFASAYKQDKEGWHSPFLNSNVTSIICFDAEDGKEVFEYIPTLFDDYNTVDEIPVPEEVIFNLQSMMGQYSNTILERQLWQNTMLAAET